ncbi:hypothetical protein GCM10022631_11260 [Deinococcus rubellus]|uniref:hypothetical protein n=1 Tax=Deinococcus rubellus TaxID=1889240 RepID=UPI0031E855B4
MNPSNRSPCTRMTSRRLLEATTPQAFRQTQPPKSVTTLERVKARGVTSGQVTSGARLHEDVPMIGRAQLTEMTRDGQTVTMVRADVAICDIVNRNGRFYPRSCYEAANAAAQADMADGGLWALMDHPDWWEPMRGSLGKIATKWTSLAIEDGREIEWPVGSGTTRTVAMVVAVGEIVGTAVGADIKALMASGIRVGISTNGYGSGQWIAAKEIDPTYYDPEELIPVVQDDFRYLSIDYVSDPSNLGGRAQTEGIEDDTPETPELPTPLEEGPMHQILKALCEKHGKTLEQIKKDHAPEYFAALEQIAEQAGAATATPPAPAQPGTPGNPAPNAPPVVQQERNVPVMPAPEVPALTAAQYQTLERTTVDQGNQIAELQTIIRNNCRDAIVTEALTSANLPSVGIRGEGEGAVDMDATFRNGLIQEARAAQDDDAARTLVNTAIEDRRHMTRHLPAATTATPARGQFEHLNRESRGGVQLPTGAPSERPALSVPLTEGLSLFGLL